MIYGILKLKSLVPVNPVALTVGSRNTNDELSIGRPVTDPPFDPLKTWVVGKEKKSDGLHAINWFGVIMGKAPTSTTPGTDVAAVLGKARSARETGRPSL